MMRSRKGLYVSLFAILITCLGTMAKATQAQDNKTTAEEAAKLGVEAYIYGYPLVTMEMTRRVMTNVASSRRDAGPDGPVRQRAGVPIAAFRDVTAPNADTLYSTAWLDLAKEPYILSLPDEDGRYYLMPMLSGWTDVFEVPGKRTTGTKAQKYAITGPGWKGELPEGVTEYKSPTNMVWILGRTYCTGTPEDYKAVHAIQDQVLRRSAQCLRQALHAAQGQGRSEDRHEDAGAGAGQPDGCGDLLQHCWRR